jgi:predicted metal-dependent hydrolase
MEKHIIVFGNTKIEFDLFYIERKHLRISVTPDLGVFVITPYNRTLEEILKKVHKRCAWIIKQQKYFKQFNPIKQPLEYFSGETHLYLGRQYRLKVNQSNEKLVKLKGKYFEIFAPSRNDIALIKDIMMQWYRNHAYQKYTDIIENLLLRLRKYGIKKPEMTVRKMKSRWGSCQSDKTRISLNIELIKAPKHCIEYVILHELVHLKIPNHNKDFYNFLGLIMPDWEYREKRLEMVKVEI